MNRSIKVPMARPTSTYCRKKVRSYAHRPVDDKYPRFVILDSLTLKDYIEKEQVRDTFQDIDVFYTHHVASKLHIDKVDGCHMLRTHYYPLNMKKVIDTTFDMWPTKFNDIQRKELTSLLEEYFEACRFSYMFCEYGYVQEDAYHQMDANCVDLITKIRNESDKDQLSMPPPVYITGSKTFYTNFNFASQEHCEAIRLVRKFTGCDWTKHEIETIDMINTPMDIYNTFELAWK